MTGAGGIQLRTPPISAIDRHSPARFSCSLSKQGERLLVSLATTEEPSGLLRKFVGSTSKHVALTTLSHVISPSTSNLRLSSIAFPLYRIIRQQSWFSWNAKLVAELIAFLYRQERFDEAESLFDETVLRAELMKERDLCKFYCDLLDSHAKSKSEKGFLDTLTRLRELVSVSSSVYVKQNGHESMVAGFCEIGLPGKAEESIREMKEMGLNLSGFVFKSLVYSYGKVGRLDDMERSVSWMEEEGFELDTVCCNMVLSSFGSHGELSCMVSWLKKMTSSGIVVSARTYNSVLNSCPTFALLLQNLKRLPLSINALLENLTQAEADLVKELQKSTVLDQVMEWKSSELKLDLHGMHLATAYLILVQWFGEVTLRFADKDQPTPAEILLVCGSGKHSSIRGESPVKGLVKEMMVQMKCPLRIDGKNIGCFIGKGKSFREWLCCEDSLEFVRAKT